MPVTALPRSFVKLGLRGLRLPLTTVEHLTNHSEDAWPPAVAFERLESRSKLMWGSILRDDELVTEGRLQAAHAKQVAEASRLEAEAEARREQADTRLEERLDQAETDRERARQQAHERERQIERERKQAEAKARADRRRRAESVKANQEARQRRVEERERDAALTRNKAQTAAVAARRDAVKADDQVEDLGAELEATKARRRAKGNG